MSCFMKEFISTLNLFLSDTGTLYGEWTAASTLGSVFIVYSPSRYAIPSNTSRNSLRTCLHISRFHLGGNSAAFLMLGLFWLFQDSIMLGLSVFILRLNVTKPNFLDICKSISIGPCVFIMWNMPLIYMTVSHSKVACAYLFYCDTPPPNANRHTGVFSSGISSSFLNILGDRRLLMIPGSILEFTSTCFVSHSQFYVCLFCTIIKLSSIWFFFLFTLLKYMLSVDLSPLLL